MHSRNKKKLTLYQFGASASGRKNRGGCGRLSQLGNHSLLGDTACTGSKCLGHLVASNIFTSDSYGRYNQCRHTYLHHST